MQRASAVSSPKIEHIHLTCSPATPLCKLLLIKSDDRRGLFTRRKLRSFLYTIFRYDHSVAILPLLAKADHMLTDGFLVKKEGLHELPPDLLHKSVLVGVDRKPVQLYWQPFSVYLRLVMFFLVL